MVEAGKSHQLKTGRINILNLTAERGDADEIGRSLHQCCKPSFLGVSQPLLEGDRRLISPGIQEQRLCSGWKRVSDRTRSKYCIATETDWCGHNVEAAADGWVGEDKFPSYAERCVFTLQHRPHMIEAFWRHITAGQF